MHISPAIDDAVRTALLPRIAGTMDESGHDRPVALAAPVLTSPMSNAYGATSMLPPTKETPISISTLLPSALDKIQEFLVRGERRQAYHYALDQRLWAHAMIIASSVDKEAWKEVVNEFLKAELGVHELQRATPYVHGKGPTSQQTNGREWLRVTYGVFSGQGPTASMWYLTDSGVDLHMFCSSRTCPYELIVKSSDRFTSSWSHVVTHHTCISKFSIVCYYADPCGIPLKMARDSS